MQLSLCSCVVHNKLSESVSLDLYSLLVFAPPPFLFIPFSYVFVPHELILYFCQYDQGCRMIAYNHESRIELIPEVIKGIKGWIMLGLTVEKLGHAGMVREYMEV